MIWNDNPIQFITCLLLSLFIGILCDMALKKLISKEEIPKSALITVFITFAFLNINGYSLTALWCILLCQLLLIGSIWDIATHTIPDFLHILIMMVGLIGFEPAPAFWGMVLVGLPLIVTAIISKKGMGGGDVKLMLAIGFAVGVKIGFTALLFGLFCSVVFENYFIMVGRKTKNEPFALIPYLGFGCGMALLSI